MLGSFNCAEFSFAKIPSLRPLSKTGYWRGKWVANEDRLIVFIHSILKYIFNRRDSVEL